MASADVIAAEDTRRAKTLLAGLGVTTSASLVSYFDGNEAARAQTLTEALRAGATVVVISDAGMPTVSDPGFRVIRAAIDAGVPIRVVPGPSAALVALALSGLPTDRFCFEGFLPRKAGARKVRLSALAEEQRTMVFFEAPHRLAAFLSDAAAAFGAQRPGAVCREMTKTFEEVVRGNLSELANWATGEVRGEITVVIAGAAPPAPDAAGLVDEVRSLIATGEKPSTAAAKVASRTGADRRSLYDAARRTQSPPPPSTVPSPHRPQ